MAKKKLKSKFVKLLLFILFVILIGVIYFCIIGDNIKNISISGNNYLKDNEIIELAGLSDYDGFLKKTSNSIIKKLKTNILIDDVKIKKKIDKTIIINVTEKKILFRNSNTDKYVLSDGKEYAFDNSYNVPLLINFVPDEVYESFVKEYKKLDLIIIDKISEIKYSPNQYDDDLFLLYMNDKNLVQVLEFTNHVPELMSISSFVVTKPGGLTLTESLASGLPILIINPIPGQEEENADFLVRHNVGIWMKEETEMARTIKDVYRHPEKLDEMRKSVEKLARPNSTKDICDVLMNTIDQ